MSGYPDDDYAVEFAVTVPGVGWVQEHPLTVTVGADDPTVVSTMPDAERLAARTASDYRRLGMDAAAAKVVVMSRVVVTTRTGWSVALGASGAVAEADQ